MQHNIFDYDHLGNRFNKVVSLLIIVILSFLIFYFVTYSWFGESETGTKVVVMGQVKLDVNTRLEFPEDLLEPYKTYDNMETTIACQENTDDAYIKVKLETDYKINGENVVFPVLYVTEEAAAEGKPSWIFSEGDNCYYYVGYVSPTESATFNTGIYVTNSINNIDKNQPVNITLTVYAIQRYYKAYEFEAEWAFAPAEWKTEIAKYDVTN